MNLLACTSSSSSYNSLRPELEIYISLAKLGHNVTLITNKNSEYLPRLIEHGIDVIEEPITKKISLKSIFLIRKIIKSKAIDIVYATNSKSIPNSAFACIGLNVKLVAYRGTASGLYLHDPSNYLGLFHPRIDGIISVSKYVHDFVCSKKILKNKSLIHIYKGHDLGWYTKQPADLSEFGIKKTDFTVVCVINSRPHKGLDVILKAANLLADLKNLHLLLVGNGTEKEPYASLIKNNKIKNNIHVAGYRKDAPELIAASSVLVQPSTSGEGLPRVVLESLAYGTPVIASANEGSKEIIEDNFNGYIVPIKNYEEIANRIRDMYNSPEKQQHLIDNSKKVLQGKMSHQLTVEKYIQYFESLLENQH